MHGHLNVKYIYTYIYIKYIFICIFVFHPMDKALFESHVPHTQSQTHSRKVVTKDLCIRN